MFDVFREYPDLCRRAYAVAISRLAVRDHSRTEIIRILSSKGFDLNISESVVNKLENEGYLKESELAERLAKSGLEKGCGRFKIMQKMNARGFDTDTAEKAVDSVYSHEDEYAAAVSAALKKLNSIRAEDISKKRIKLARFLFSRGFGHDVTMNAVDEVLSSHGDIIKE